MAKIKVNSSEKKQVLDITDNVNREIGKLEIKEGIVNLFVTHTTCALTTADLDPGTEGDYLNAFEEIIPKLNYYHPHDPSHMPDHILSSLIGTSLTIPVEGGKLVLGTWQRVILLEFNGPKEREIIISSN